jgi:DNA-binding transcriptional LysR family regulator
LQCETIADLFRGEIGLFLTQGTVLFGSIGELLAEQVGRLSAVEQTVLRALALGREPLIVAPILSRLRKAYPGRVEVEEHLLSLLQQLRERPYERLTITGVQ